ncbi:MAG TPA: methyltransferase domain-containing protein [Micromonosporaceae bacterium]|nr:methyltransferase domain-containing protein [Micromonosporaceae bacterium]
MPTRSRPRNDPGQYDDLAGEWWRPDGVFAMLHWLARARARLVPPAGRDGAILVDLGCGAGLLAPHIADKGYRHLGFDLVPSALAQAREHGVTVVAADVTRLPLADGCADVVCAGELFEHVPDLSAAVAEACRVLRPGGLLVLDTLADTAVCRFVAVTLAEQMYRGAVSGIHDPDLFVDPDRLVRRCAENGVRLRVSGIRPAMGDIARWLITRRGEVRIVPTWSKAVLYQGSGVKESE